MKKLSFILAMLVATCCYAQQETPMDASCSGWLPGYPDHYCDCRAGTPFQFPLEVEITDTMWFSSSVDDLKLGLSAYWIGNSSLTFEVYAFCSSITPTIKITVGRDQMREMSIDEINTKLDQMGGANMSGVIQNLVPRIKVYPNGEGGKVYCYPYDQGPHSTCDSILRFLPVMTYVCDQAEEVYKLQPNNISSNGIGFIRWKQKNNQPATIRLTKDSCNGQEIANVTLRDSLHVYMLDTALMKAIKEAEDTVYVHVTHDPFYVGRIFYRNSIKWDSQQIDTTLCQGKMLQLGDTAIGETTVYPNDTLWKASDTLSLTTYYLTMEAPTPLYDTLRLKAKQLPYNYRNQIIPKDGWGDYDFTIHQANRCDERWLVHVEHDVVKTEMTVNDTLCMGKTVTYGDITYVSDTVIRDSAWIDADTWAIRDITIRFTEPQVEYDTIAIPASWFNNGRYWYSDLGVTLYGYGDTLIVKTKKNQCTRWIQLHVEEREIGTFIEAVPQDEQTYKYMRNGILYIRREGHEYDLLGRPIGNQ